MGKPLTGKVIALTRPEIQAGPLAEKLRKAGARVVVAPLIRIAPPNRTAGLDDALKTLGRFDAIIFTSGNAVERFFDRAKEIGASLRKKPRGLFAVGPETARALHRHGWRDAKVPKIHRAAELAKFIGPLRGKFVLLPRAEAASSVLPKMLKAGGAKVLTVTAYRTVADPKGLSRLKKEMKNGLDVVCFTSGSAAMELARGLGRQSTRRLFSKSAAASLGPVTTAALKACGIKAGIRAEKATARHLFKAIEEHFSSL